MELPVATAFDSADCTWPGCPEEVSRGRWCDHHRWVLKRAASRNGGATSELLRHCSDLGRQAARRERPQPVAVEGATQAELEARARALARGLGTTPGGWTVPPARKQQQVQTLAEALAAL